ncbi:phosphatase PAP2 family protein [Flavimarina sp. Hel_I_48]|uniref:phosphatase PAP2 family protein n=1 Tax=Flavimarina sp. Hel_I_48 TaxID=1392488 RepID=UPI0004DFA67D|nr:phosphatase PAP2 family protein [Flavimarina sp. Hel_I_48]
MKKLLFPIISLLISPLWSQSSPSTKNGQTKIWKDLAYDLGVVFKGVHHAYKQPLHWQGNDYLKLAGVAAGTLGFYLADNEINHVFTRNKKEVPPVLLNYGWRAGKPLNNYGITGAVYLTGLISKNTKLRRTGVLLISSATATGLFQQFIKTGLGRARPSTGLGKNHFKPFDPSSAYSSFPSGHGILTFTTAHAIAKQFDNNWVKAGVYGIGVIPGLSRIVEDAHWASDVFLSWAMSYFIVESIDRYLDSKYDEKYNPGEPKETSLNLTFSGNRLGLQFNF